MVRQELIKQVVNIGKYITNQTNVNHNGTIFKVKNFVPVIHNEDRDEQKNKIEECLYKVFSKYIRKQL